MVDKYTNEAMANMTQPVIVLILLYDFMLIFFESKFFLKTAKLLNYPYLSSKFKTIKYSVKQLVLRIM